MNLQKNISLKNYTTFKIGGLADYFVEARSAEEVREALIWGQENKQEILIISGGSNTLVHEKGFAGLVIRPNINHLEIDGTSVRVGPGVLLSYLINMTLEQGLTGLEFAAGVPGTVGGAVRGNAGTYGIGMWDVIDTVTYIDPSYEIKEIKRADGHYSYRHSIFKENPWVILDVKLKLVTGDVKESRQLIKERLERRLATQPKNEASAGCMFKNAPLAGLAVDKLKAMGLELEQFQTTGLVPAGYLIDKADLKGYQIGGAKISDIHGNYVINTGTATADDIMMLISYIKQQIRDKYGVQLEEEVKIVV